MREPLHKLLGAGSPDLIPDLTEDQERAFRNLTTAVTSPPVPELPRNGLTYSVYTDALEYQVGAANLQTDD